MRLGRRQSSAETVQLIKKVRPGQRIVGKVLGGYLGPDEVILVFFSWGAGVEPSLRPCGFSRVAGVEIRRT